MQRDNLEAVTKELRLSILKATTKAGSGHPTSSLSAVELLTVLMFDGYFKADLKNPQDPNNDRLILSKGHAAPLFYALYKELGVIDENELLTLRQFGSRLEGHPTMKFPWTEAATGSLGQGLSVGVGMALAAQLDKRRYHTYVLLGDGELMEGSNWEALALAKHYHLENITAIVDLNRLEQDGESIHGWQVEILAEKVRAFGWLPIVVQDGNNLEQVRNAFKFRFEQPKLAVILAKTKKGKGVSFLEDKLNWHGKALNEAQLKEALREILTEEKPRVDTETKEDLLLKRLAKLTNA